MANNHERLRSEGRSIVLYLPKIQTAEEAALWNYMLFALEEQLDLPEGTLRCYVLVEQLEASYHIWPAR